MARQQAQLLLNMNSLEPVNFSVQQNNTEAFAVALCHLAELHAEQVPELPHNYMNANASWCITWFHVLCAKMCWMQQFSMFSSLLRFFFFPSSGPLCFCEWHHETLEAAVSSSYPACQSKPIEQHTRLIKYWSAAAPIKYVSLSLSF